MFRAELQRLRAIIFVRIHFVSAPLLFRLHAINIFQKFEETEQNEGMTVSISTSGQAGCRAGRGKVCEPGGVTGSGASGAAESPRTGGGKGPHGPPVPIKPPPPSSRTGPLPRFKRSDMPGAPPVMSPQPLAQDRPQKSSRGLSHTEVIPTIPRISHMRVQPAGGD